MMLTEWLNQRTQRERYMMIAGALIILILSLDFFIWQPLDNAITQLQQTVIQNRSLLVWMTNAKTKLNQWQQAGYTATIPNSGGLLITVEQSLTQIGLSHYLTNTSEQSTDNINLSFSHVPFDLLIDWLQTIWVHHNIVVKKIMIQKGTESGIVNVVVTLCHFEGEKSEISNVVRL